MCSMSTRKGTIVSINTSPGGIPKTPIGQCDVTTDGLAGDDHNHEKHGTPMQAVSLLDEEDLEDLKTEGYDVYPGATGENVTVRGMDVDALDVGDVLQFSGGLKIEVTKKRKPCYVLDSIDPQLKKVFGGRCGVLAKVLEPATISTGETIEVVESTTAV